jgi:O-antigen/teichoic acid export membrane protein
MDDASTNNKRIAKNTIFLNIRTLLMMIVMLYTSRVVLSVLGFVDYGLYNLLAGVIMLFSFLSDAMGTAISRFMSFELGRKETNNLANVFCTSFSIHTGLAIIIFVFSETIGLYIVNNILVIPSERLFACNVIYQYAVVTALLSITQVPMNAMIVSYEKMNVYSYIGIVNVILKLMVAYAISISTFDKLITFGTLNLIVSIGVYFFYHLYCKKKFSAYNIGFRIDKKLFKEMGIYSLWNLLLSSSQVVKNYGINVLINIFFGPLVNTANTIAYQVNSAMSGFSNSFSTAINPPIIKSYSANERLQMKNLIFRGSKFSFFLLMIISIPILLETDIILKLWLKDVPQYTVELTKLMILVALIESFVIPVSVGVQATGKVKYYYIVVASVYLVSFPIAYLFYKSGAQPTAALQILIALAIFNIFVRLYFLKKYVGISILEFSLQVLLRAFIILILSIIVPLFIYHFFNVGLLRLLITTLSSLFISGFFIYSLGLTKQEREKINLWTLNILSGNLRKLKT